MKNERDNLAKKIGKELVGSECTSFAMGVKWADYHPNWKEDKPKYEELDNGLPKLYFCQILTLDMTFGYRYSYRVGFINKEGDWNIERKGSTKVIRYLEIYGPESKTNLLKDIEKFNKDELE